MHFGSKVHSANEWNDADFCGKMKTTAVAGGVAGRGQNWGIEGVCKVLWPNSLFLLFRWGRLKKTGSVIDVIPGIRGIKLHRAPTGVIVCAVRI